MSYFCKRDRVQSVLAGNLKTDLVTGLGVPSSFSTSLNLRVDLVVVCSREDAQVVGRGDGSSVLRSRVSDSSRVVCDSRLLDIITSRGTSQEAILTNNSIDVGGRALQEIEEGTAVEVGLFEVQVELRAVGLGSREEGTQELGLETLSNGVIELNLGVKCVDGVPRLCNR